jgi:tetratricopeptide (TPR) repeat protein
MIMIANVKSFSKIVGLVVWGLLVGGCGQSSVVRVTRTGGIALDSSMVLALGNISGDQTKDFRTELTKALKANIDFKMLREGYGQEPLSDSLYATIARSLADTQQSLVLITGRYTAEANTENMVRYTADNKKTEYVKKTVTGRLSVRLSDLTNNTLSFSRDLQASTFEEKEPNWLLYAIVDALRTDPMFITVRGRVIDAFIDELHPHNEYYDVVLLYDSKLPELETGISHAKLGHWDKAIELFKSVPERYPNNENIHKAYFNIGIAYKWNYMFAEARQNLEKAYLLKNNSEYFDEIQRLAQFEQEYIIRQTEKSLPPK